MRRDDQDVPVAIKWLTIKDVVEIVGHQPHDVKVQNSWIVLAFNRCTFRMKNTHGKGKN